jgi:predicted nuclease with TOPRIM domain
MPADTKSADLTFESEHPPSVFTSDSVFADSAISVGATTPKFSHADDQLDMNSDASEASQPTISERLSNLAAGAFAIEESHALGHDREQTIRQALADIQNCLESNDEERESGAQSLNEEPGEDSEVAISRTGELEDIQLHEIHASLAATVASMRQRQQEQRHLHSLTIEKLNAVGQTCWDQRQELQDLRSEIESLRHENQTLGRENDAMKERLADIEEQATQREVAVHAMSSTVSGLEGWINNSPMAERYRSSPARQTPRRGKLVVRGQGRFRGRYFVDDPDGEVVLDGGQDDGTEIHDGVRSWLKGFRDVEEQLFKATPSRVIRTKEARNDAISADDDWGDFESVSAA